MITADNLADEVLQYVCNRVNVTTGTREDIRQFVISKVAPLAPRAQSSLNFSAEDKAALEGQALAILQLLKERRSAGALSHELAQIALSYTRRISDIREMGYKVFCERQSGRTYRYTLAATDW